MKEGTLLCYCLYWTSLSSLKMCKPPTRVVGTVYSQQHNVTEAAICNKNVSAFYSVTKGKWLVDFLVQQITIILQFAFLAHTIFTST